MSFEIPDKFSISNVCTLYYSYNHLKVVSYLLQVLWKMGWKLSLNIAFFLSTKTCPIWLSLFASGYVPVHLLLWHEKTGLFTIRYLDVPKLITKIPLPLLVSCKPSLPIIRLKATTLNFFSEISHNLHLINLVLICHSHLNSWNMQIQIIITQ
jgi:hypothetical protein